MKGVPPDRRVVWASSSPPGVEFCVVSRRRAGWTLLGAVARRERPGLSLVNYQVDADPAWKTKRVWVEQTLGGETRTLAIQAESHLWRVQGRVAEGLAECSDVDLQVSPSTNTIPLKRAHLEVGSKLELTVAWVRFPSLKVQPLCETYERLSNHRYIYSSGRFKAEIEVDGFGLVRRYGDYWLALGVRPS